MKEKDFKGPFYYDFKEEIDLTICNEAPLAIIKLATKYQLWICSCKGENYPHTTYTIWFD